MSADSQNRKCREISNPEAERDVPQLSAATYEDMDVLREKERTPILVTKKK